MATLGELAELTGGRVVGNSLLVIERLSAVDTAAEGDITFISNPKYLPQLMASKASAVIVPPSHQIPGFNLLVCENPYLAFAKVLTALHTEKPVCRGIMAGATVDSTADIGSEVTIHPGCVIGARVRIGSGTVIYPNSVVYDDVVIGCDCLLHAGSIIREKCQLGDRVILQPGAIIGSDGFGFAPDGDRYYKIPQVGIVVLEDDVEIGSAAVVDRAALSVTRIRRGTKLDNLVQIAHNVDVGEDCVFAAQSGIAGSARIGRHCTFGGQAAAAGHLKIGDNVTVGGRGGVTSNVDGDQILSGIPAIAHKSWLRSSMVFAKLPEMRREIKQLKAAIDQLKSEE